MPRTLVTLGTDGTNNWVQIPTGEKLSLGTLSPLDFVSKLSSGPVEARRVLNAFNGAGSAVVGVDMDRMWVLFRPNRTRWAGGPRSLDDGSFMASPSMKPANQQTERSMATIFEDLNAVEKHVEALKKQASEGKKATKEDLEGLVRLAGKIKSPNQSDNSTYYNLGAPDVYEVTDKMPKVPTAKTASVKLAYDVFKANADVANGILGQAETTVSAIDRLANAGKRFNSVRAKQDVLEVTTKVAGIMQDADLTQPWVSGDLDKLASRMGEIHGLFETKPKAQ